VGASLLGEAEGCSCTIGCFVWRGFAALLGCIFKSSSWSSFWGCSCVITNGDCEIAGRVPFTSAVSSVAWVNSLAASGMDGTFPLFRRNDQRRIHCKNSEKIQPLHKFELGEDKPVRRFSSPRIQIFHPNQSSPCQA
jgi:hypothetical protein